MAEQWIVPDWPAPPRVRAFSTLRSGGASRAPYATLNLAAHVGDDPAAVAVNRRRLASLLHLPGDPAWLHQVHGRQVEVLQAAPRATPRADAAVTAVAGRVCAVLTADCLPVLFADRDAQRVGVAHAGWRGLAAGVLEATLQAIGCPPSELLVWLGPAIGADAYEVGEEVRQAFVAADPATAAGFRPSPAGRWLADLSWLARHRLARAGLAAGQVFGAAACTYRDARSFFSYRRDGVCGRMATGVWLAE